MCDCLFNARHGCSQHSCINRWQSLATDIRLCACVGLVEALLLSTVSKTTKGEKDADISLPAWDEHFFLKNEGNKAKNILGKVFDALCLQLQNSWSTEGCPLLLQWQQQRKSKASCLGFDTLHCLAMQLHGLHFLMSVNKVVATTTASYLTHICSSWSAWSSVRRNFKAWCMDRWKIGLQAANKQIAPVTASSTCRLCAPAPQGKVFKSMFSCLAEMV